MSNKKGSLEDSFRAWDMVKPKGVSPQKRRNGLLGSLVQHGTFGKIEMEFRNQRLRADVMANRSVYITAKNDRLFPSTF